MTAPSPGILTRFIINLHYPSEEAYVEALAEVMKTEYRAIVEAGFVLQIDAPDLGSGAQQPVPPPERRRIPQQIAERNIAALNAATEGLPADRMRLHICWGNYEGPHNFDLPLLKIIDIAFKARPQAISIEAANPRHDHEWEDLKTIKIPDDKILIPGVIDSTTNFVEHPQAGGAAHSALRRHRRPRARDRRRRLRLRHRGADRADGGRQHRLGEAQGAQRRRRDRKRAAVGIEGGMTRTSKAALIAAVAFMIFPGESPADAVKPESVWRRLDRPEGATPEEFELIRVASYKFQSLYRASAGATDAIFLAGDAAHQMPPFLAQGLCSGFRDAHNLAWKLDLVLRGKAPPAFLDNYEAERGPNARPPSSKACASASMSTNATPRRCESATSSSWRCRRRTSARSGRKQLIAFRVPGFDAGFTAAGARRSARRRRRLRSGRVRRGGQEGRFDDIAGRGFMIVGRNGDPAAGAVARRSGTIGRRIGGRIVRIGGDSDGPNDASSMPTGQYTGLMDEYGCDVIVKRPTSTFSGRARRYASCPR